MSCGSSPPSGYVAVMSVPVQYQFYNYNIKQQRKRLKEQTNKVYDQLSNSYITTTKKFTYGNAEHNYPTLTEEINSTGEKVFNSTAYVIDYPYGCSNPLAGSFMANILEMQTKHIYGLPVEKLQYRQAANGTNRRYINGQLTDYKLGLPQKIYFLEATPLLTTLTPAVPSCLINSSYPNYRLAGTFTYDALMNLKEESKINDVVLLISGDIMDNIHWRK